MRTKPRALAAVTSVTALAAGGWLVRLTALAAVLSLSGCGMETAATAVSAAKLQAQQAQAALQKSESAKQQLDEANAQIELRKKQVDAATQ